MLFKYSSRLLVGLYIKPNKSNLCQLEIYTMLIRHYNIAKNFLQDQDHNYIY